MNLYSRPRGPRCPIYQGLRGVQKILGHLADFVAETAAEFGVPLDTTITLIGGCDRRHEWIVSRQYAGACPFVTFVEKAGRILPLADMCDLNHTPRVE